MAGMLSSLHMNGLPEVWCLCRGRPAKDGSSFESFGVHSVHSVTLFFARKVSIRIITHTPPILEPNPSSPLYEHLGILAYVRGVAIGLESATHRSSCSSKRDTLGVCGSLHNLNPKP